MELNEIIAALKKRGMRNTKCRQDLLELLASRNKALTAREIHQQLQTEVGRTIDLATVYRNLGTLEELGFIHLVSGGAYHLCQGQKDQDQCVLYSCEACGTTNELTCKAAFMEPILMHPSSQLKLTRIRSILVQGICESCVVAEEN